MFKRALATAIILGSIHLLHKGIKDIRAYRERQAHTCADKIKDIQAYRERQAQICASKIAKDQMAANPGLDDERKKKIKSQALQIARDRSDNDIRIELVEND